jgi:1-acyl-sn-glycerol-3-phosphate acyltransferase
MRYWLYHLATLLLNLPTRIFIRKIHIDGEENFPSNKPVLLACNHPNSFYDGVVFEYFYKYSSKIFTLARGDAFNKPLPNYVLRSFRLLPIYRARDARADVARKRNSETNDEMYEIFRKNNCILIFPEGSAYPEKDLRSLKRGTGGLAVEMAKKGDFELDLYVVPTALNYSEFGTLRRTVHISYGKPISIKNLKEEIKTNERKVMSEITKHIEKSLKKMVVITKGENEAEKELVHQMMVNENQVPYQFLIKEKWNTSIEKANNLAGSQLEKVAAYSKALKKLNLTDANVSEKSFNFLSMFVAIATMGISLPVYLIWAMIWYITVKQCNKRIKNPIFIDSVIIGSGMIFTFLLFITVSVLFLVYAPTYWSLVFIVASIYGAICWFRLVDAAPKIWKSLRWFGLKDDVRAQVKAQRQEIMSWVTS